MLRIAPEMTGDAGSFAGTKQRDMLFFRWGESIRRPPLGESAMSLGMILIIIVVIYLLGGFSGRFGGYGYGMGHSGWALAA